MLSYRHENGAVMMRSAQPNPSSTKRCRADESVLNCLLKKSQRGVIIDTFGGGKNSSKTCIENEQHYSQWKRVVRPIANFNHPSGILECFSKIVEACNDVHSSTEKWISRLESSGWMSLILNSLNTACIVAQCLAQDRVPVIVHGGKGMDSTLIVTSLVQIILNPDCRTVRGLQALIDREWLQGGHPFATRHSQSCYTPPTNRLKTSGSTFVLFLDCCYQLYMQFPLSFEFDSHLLITLFEHSYFSQYGTFIADTECERVESLAFTKTTSLWSHLNRPDVMTSLLNPAYEPNQSIIWPSVAPLSLVLWRDLFLRFVIETKQKKKINHQIQTMISTQKELRARAVRLRQQINVLQKEHSEFQVDESNNNAKSNVSYTTHSLFNGAN
jgi:myotubularin-related protein 9